MKILLALFFVTFSLQSFAQTIINDKNAEVRNVGSFSAIKASGGVDIYLSQSDDYALAVSASDPKYRDAVKTEVKNGVLNISYDGRSFKFSSNPKLRVYLSFKTLESLEGSGACDFIINGTLKGSSLKIKLSGACDVKGNISFENVDLALSGASTAKVNGTVSNIKISASGASDVKNYDLVTDNCIADISGASDIKITVNKSLNAKASGASSLYYKGNPEKKDARSSGASSISQRN